MRKIGICILLLFLFAFCKKDEEKVDFGYDYFPMEEGHYVTYEVTEIFHDEQLNPKHDTVRYQLKRKIGEKIVDNEGRTARKFYLSKWSIISGQKVEERVWTRLIDKGKGEVVEENQRKIRLVFAVKKDEEWDLNAFNTSAKKEIHYLDVDVPRTINSFHFDKTTKIYYEDFFSLVDYQKGYEIYARGVGLVKRSFKDLTIHNFDTLDINKGKEIYYKVIGYGTE